MSDRPDPLGQGGSRSGLSSLEWPWHTLAGRAGALCIFLGRLLPLPPQRMEGQRHGNEAADQTFYCK